MESPRLDRRSLATAGALVLSLVVLTAGCAPRTVVDATADEAALREIKEMLWPKAYAEQDVALLDSLLADEFQMVDAEGNWSSKADELAYVRDTPPSYDSLVFDIKRLDIFENGTAIVAGEGIVKGEDEDGPYQFRYQSSNILIKRDGSWKAIASHVSGISLVEPEMK